jgi:glycosyltransferase involved in cell wall biosynthesis
VRHFLMISPFFPPMSFVGAKRALTLSRHLPAHGWRPAVLALPEHLEVDGALRPFVPDVPIDRGYRSGPLAWVADAVDRLTPPRPVGDARARTTGVAPTGIRARLAFELDGLPFDKYTRYLPWAGARALRFLRRHDCRLIYVSAGPFSAMYLGTALAEVTGLPLVLDLRDPWAVDPLYSEAWTDTGRALANRLEAWAFGRAQRVVLNSASSLALYREAYATRFPADHFDMVRNHFDPGLYDPAPPPPGPADPFRIVFFGHLTPLRDGRLFFEGLRRFIDAEALAPGAVEVVTLGEVTPADETAIDALGLRSFVRAHPWVSFVHSRALLGRADVLLDLTGPRHHLRIAGKLYDYMAAGRPVLSVSNNPEVADIHARTRIGRCVGHDAFAIADALRAFLADKRADRPFAPDAAAIAEFSAAPAAAHMAAIFDTAVEARIGGAVSAERTGGAGPLGGAVSAKRTGGAVQ